MQLQEYQQAALRTESKIEKLKFNKEYTLNVLKLFSIVATILDDIKKGVFYNKPSKLNDESFRSLDYQRYLSQVCFRNKDIMDEEIELDPRVFHGIVGIATEAGELIDVLISNLEKNTAVDAVNVQEEISDIAWYTAILNDKLDLNWAEGLQRNIAKLKARYPDKFNTTDAINRNLEVERQILEG